MPSSDSLANSTSSTSQALACSSAVDRRQFIRYSVAMVAGGAAGAVVPAHGGSATVLPSYRIDPASVKTTAEQMLAFDLPTPPMAPVTSARGLHPTQMSRVQDYDKLGYGKYWLAPGLPVVPRYDLLAHAATYQAPAKRKRLAHFFAMTDVHITDKEAPNQLLYIQQADAERGGPMTSIYSPTILYTTQLLDAAIQTINALHERSAFDFGISLGDVCDSGRYNELRWYIDVIDGKPIHPSSGAHLGADTVDFQKPFQAVGLNPSIPWYQALGNHDHFYIGSVPVDADPKLKLRESYVSDQVWAVGDVLIPNASKSVPMALPPVIYDVNASLAGTSKVTLNDPITGVVGNTFYMGVVDGTSPYGAIRYAGKKEDFASAPKVAPDPNRRALLRSEWIGEFFNTTTQPKGHGFHLVPEDLRRTQDGFACYRFPASAMAKCQGCRTVRPTTPSCSSNSPQRWLRF